MPQEDLYNFIFHLLFLMYFAFGCSKLVGGKEEGKQKPYTESDWKTSLR
jgi:hypothetical protein